jgi:hypothetical protein
VFLGLESLTFKTAKPQIMDDDLGLNLVFAAPSSSSAGGGAPRKKRKNKYDRRREKGRLAKQAKLAQSSSSAATTANDSASDALPKDAVDAVPQLEVKPTNDVSHRFLPPVASSSKNTDADTAKNTTAPKGTTAGSTSILAPKEKTTTKPQVQTSDVKPSNASVPTPSTSALSSTNLDATSSRRNRVSIVCK